MAQRIYHIAYAVKLCKLLLTTQTTESDEWWSRLTVQEPDSVILQVSFGFWEKSPFPVNYTHLMTFCLCNIAKANNVKKNLRQTLHCPLYSIFVSKSVHCTVYLYLLSAIFGLKKKIFDSTNHISAVNYLFFFVWNWIKRPSYQCTVGWTQERKNDALSGLQQPLA